MADPLRLDRQLGRDAGAAPTRSTDNETTTKGRAARRASGLVGSTIEAARQLPPSAARRCPEGRARAQPQRSRGRAAIYLISTVAPAASSCALILAASSLETASLTAFGAASTRSLASFRPRPVIARTSLMTLIFWAPNGGQDHVELGLLLGRLGRAPRRRRRRPPPPPAPPPRRPTSPRASSTAAPPRGRSGPTGPRPADPNSPSQPLPQRTLVQAPGRSGRRHMHVGALRRPAAPRAPPAPGRPGRPAPAAGRPAGSPAR